RNTNPFAGQGEPKISWEEAKEIVLEAFSGFSKETKNIAEMFFDKGWIDAALGPNKRGGAFAHPGMAQTDNPFVMINYRGTARDVMTLAHELGHGVHQYLEAENKAVMHAPLTFAETASVFGEMLTFKLLLERAENEEQKRKIMFEKVNDMINTTMRQISFYDFEKRTHRQFKEEGKPLTTEDFGRHWVGALQDSYGEAIPLDEDYGVIFGYVPHLIHTPFYVYAYAFGDSLVNALYQVYEEGTIPKEEFVEKYTDMLAAGGTYTAEDLKEDFGLDIADPAFWNKGLDMIEGMINQLEELCEPILDAENTVNTPDIGQP
ncbi:MAG: M3 family metallopeptidase, partial [Alphaproteobacteria bacterium]